MKTKTILLAITMILATGPTTAATNWDGNVSIDTSSATTGSRADGLAAVYEVDKYLKAEFTALSNSNTVTFYKGGRSGQGGTQLATLNPGETKVIELPAGTISIETGGSGYGEIPVSGTQFNDASEVTNDLPGLSFSHHYDFYDSSSSESTDKILFLKEIKVKDPNTNVEEDSTEVTDSEYALQTFAEISFAATNPIAFGLLAQLPDISFDFTDNDKQLFKEDIVSNALIIESDREQFIKDSELNVEQAYGQSMAEAKVEAVESLNNGTGEYDARQKVLDNIDNFYADYERRLFAQYNREILNLENTLTTADEVDLAYENLFKQDFKNFSIIEGNHTLPNGETMPYYTVVAYDGTTVVDLKKDSTPGLITNASDSQDEAKYIESDGYNTVWDQIRNQRQNARTQTKDIVTRIYNNFNQGDIDVTDVRSPLETLQQARTSYDSTGSYQYATLTYEQLGLATGQNYAFTVQYNNSDMNDTRTEEGQLFVDGNDFGTLETNVTYDASNKEAWMIAQKQAKTQRINLDGTFTIKEMRDTVTGNLTTSVNTTVDRAYKPNITALEQQIEDLRQKQQELSGPAGGGLTGGFFNGIGIPEFAPEIKPLHAALGGAAIIVILLAIIG
jgi:hypothetical protein